MPRFFVDNTNENAEITGDDFFHISHSLRMKIGDPLTLCNKNGMDFSCIIESISDSSVFCRVIESHKSLTEPNTNLTLYQAMPKLDKFEFILQKAVELGVSKVIPVLTDRCISRPDVGSFNKKLERFKKISLEAAKQSGRGIIPLVESIVPFKTAISDLNSEATSIICYENGGERLNLIPFSPSKDINLFIGSEGGWNISEIDFAASHGLYIATLGSRILRCETAPLAAISIIMNLIGDM